MHADASYCATNELKSGVPDRIRTDDIQLGKLTLYQLSYGRSVVCRNPEC